MKQTTNAILMIRPVAFRMNEQTTASNHYQKALKDVLPATLQARALREFDDLVEKLRTAGVQVIVVDDIPGRNTPDSVFPNNWVSFHQNGDVALYPMMAENRRQERREDVLDILEEHGFYINDVVDYTEAEDEGYFLEGTGAMVLDRANGKAYCALSPRVEEELFIEFCEDFEMTPVIFEAFQTVDNRREPIYHTNVMLSIGNAFAILCADCIADKKERKHVVDNLKENGKEIIYITEAQVASFAGNVLEVSGADGKPFIVMSQAALAALNAGQIRQLEKYGEILSSNLETIEACGGGSARCMMAEIFLPKA